jgi:hypothetical protein
MGQSHIRHREEQRTLRRLSAVVGLIVDEARTNADRALAPDTHSRIVGEIVAYTDPWYFAGRDAPIPAHRHDVMRVYAAWRIARGAVPRAERDELARALMPVPDHAFNGSAPNFAPDYREALSAHRRRRARRRKGDAISNAA